MATYKHLRSSTANKRPTTSIADGQLAINTNTASPGLFFKDSAGTGIVKVGPVHVGTTAPNSTPAGSAGNYVGEQWLDTTGGTYVFKVWDGSAWRSETGTFVDVNGDTMTGALGIIAGSASTPGLFFSGDANTGVYSPGADQLALSTNGSARIYANSTGDVGIGVTSVASGGANTRNVQLHNTNSDGTYFKLTNGATGATAGDGMDIIVDGSGNGYIFNRENAALILGAGNLERLRITSGGLVGIGTSSPSFLLDAFKPSAGTVARFQANGTDSNISIKNSTREGVIGSDNTQSYLLNTDAFPWSFWTNNTERLRITADGKLGIGTSSPAVPLHVSGDGNSLRLQRSTYSGTGETVSLDFRHFASNLSADYAGATITSVTTDSFTAGGGAGLFDAALTFSTLNDAVSAERMRISSSGNVGIGTTSPGAQVDINSTAAYGLRINHATAPFQSFTVNGTQTFTIGANSGGGGSFYYGTGNVEAARIDSSGRLLVGTSSARSGVGIEGISPQLQVESAGTASGGSLLLTVNAASAFGPEFILAKSRGTSAGSNTIAQNNDALGSVVFSGADGSDIASEAAAIRAFVDGTPGANDMPGRLVFSTTADGAASPTERMRIESTGRTGTYASASDGFQVSSNAAAGTTYANFVGRHDGGAPFDGTISLQIWNNGNVQNTNNSYTAISDIKLKENVVDANSQWSDIKALQVRNYNLKKGQTHRQIGLIAQEVEPISPGLVYESPDRDKEGNDLGTVTKSVNYSVLYMKAVKALQEAMERIETLEAKVAALESA